jgi:hypothetical protein
MSEPDQPNEDGSVTDGSVPQTVPHAVTKSGMTNGRKPPRWVQSFLRALERTGEARAAAADAGVDHSTAYARRRTHGEFADRWVGALRAHKEAKARGEAEEIAAVKAGGFPRAPSPGSPLASPPSPSGGEGLVASGGQMKRAGPGRWTKAKEKIFFDELAATANARAAAAAVGLSKNAVLQRRARHPAFAAKWDAVVASAKASINLYLVEASNQTFDPDTLDTGEVTPKVTIDQAIKISQLRGPATARAAGAGEEYEEPEPSDPGEEMRERLIRKLRRMHQRDIVDKQAAGWSYDASYDVLVPPGWVQGRDYRPKETEDPGAMV